MPRKTTKTARTPKPTAQDKTRLELRFDPALYTALTNLTSQLGVSVNRFLEALTQWALTNAVLGDPDVSPIDGHVSVTARPGAVFFGTPGSDTGSFHGNVHFAIDFNSRWAIHQPADFPGQLR